jgi:hypothetical protein
MRVDGDEIRVTIETTRGKWRATVKASNGAGYALADAFHEAKAMWSKDTPSEGPLLPPPPKTRSR